MVKHLKHTLLDRYGRQKLFAEVNGYPDVVQRKVSSGTEVFQKLQ